MNKFVKGILGVILSAAVAGTTLAGCGSTGTGGAGSNSGVNASSGKLDPNNPTEITFYSYSLGYPTMKAGMEHLISSFNETVGKEKGVVVKGVVDNNMSQNSADIAAGMEVDIVQHAFGMLDASRLNLGFKSYEELFPADELAEHTGQMIPNALELGKINGQMYGLAFTFSTPILYINKGLFEQAGLDTINLPKTWDDVYKAAVQIKEKTGKDGFGLAPDNGWISEGLIFSNGGEVLSSDKTEAKFDSPEAVEAYEMWNKLYSSGAAVKGSDKDVMDAFMAGNVAMNLQSTSLLSGYQSAAKAGGWELLGAEMPQFGDKASVPVNSGSCLAVRSDDPTKSAAEWEFIKYATGKEGYTIITSEIGYLPLRMDITEDPAYLKDFVDANPIVKTNLKQLERIKPVTIWPGTGAKEEYQVFLDATVKSITEGNVQNVLSDAAKQMNDLLKNN